MELKTKVREALDKQAITKISVFDFDGTLIDTPLPETGRLEYEKKTGKAWPHKGWWSKPESLDTSVFDMPPIPSVIKSYNKEKANPNTLIVMMTGRQPRLANEVKGILHDKGLTFDKYIYNYGGSTVESKIKSLNELLIDYPKVDDVLLTDDRIPHIPTFEEWGKKLLDSGRLRNFKIDVVPTGRH